MGSGDRITVWRAEGVGLGITIGRFPFALTISMQVLLWGFSIGFGKGYDQ
jgi:hypothetical protein